MGGARNIVVGNKDPWSIEHDGSRNGDYVTTGLPSRPVGVATSAIMEGHSVTIPPGTDDQSSVGWPAVSRRPDDSLARSIGRRAHPLHLPEPIALGA
jgi:hypothetical protein